MHKSISQLFTGIRGGILIFGIFIAAFAIAGAVADISSPIGAAPDVVEKVYQIKIDAIPLSVAVFFIIIADSRPAFLKRAPLAILGACFCWLIAWKLFFYCVYEQLHLQEIDLDKVLQDATPH